MKLSEIAKARPDLMQLPVAELLELLIATESKLASALERATLAEQLAEIGKRQFIEASSRLDAYRVSVAKLVHNLQEVRSIHRDPESSEYNECDKPGEECCWCDSVQRTIDELPDPPLKATGRWGEPNADRVAVWEIVVEKLSPDDSRRFAEALANPPEPSETLKAAAKAWQALKEHEQRRDPRGHQAYLDAHAELDRALGRTPLPAFNTESE